MDYGFKFGETEGLFIKIANRRGIQRSRPLDLIWMAEISRGRGEGDFPAGTVPSVAVDMAGGDITRRSSPFSMFRAPLTTGQARKERGDHCRLTKTVLGNGNRTRVVRGFHRRTVSSCSRRCDTISQPNRNLKKKEI
jgi:hypothetical protein